MPAVPSPHTHQRTVERRLSRSRKLAAVMAVSVALPLAVPAAAGASPLNVFPLETEVPPVSIAGNDIPVGNLTDVSGVTAAEQTSRDGGPTSQPFSPERIARFYESDNSEDRMFYFSVIEPFENLRANHPDVMDENLEKVIAINNSVADDRETQLYALDDSLDDPLYVMSDALGATLGQHFRDAYNEGHLPKTRQLLSGNLARGGGIASSTFAEKYYYDYERPYDAAPDRMNHYERDGETGDTRSSSPSFPSGHTNKAAWTASLLSLMVPEAGPQIQARASEAGHNRIVLGVHYPIDVIGGRMTGNAAAADRWADPEFRPLVQEAATELRDELEFRCGGTLSECVAGDTPYLSDAGAVSTYTERMTYGFDRIGEAGQSVTVPDRYAGLLETRFPELSHEQRKQVLAHTAIDSGYPMDRTDGSASHNRMNLARAMAAQVTVNADGSLTING